MNHVQADGHVRFAVAQFEIARIARADADEGWIGPVAVGGCHEAGSESKNDGETEGP